MNLPAPDSPLLRQVLKGGELLQREAVFSPRAAVDEDILAEASEHEERWLSDLGADIERRLSDLGA